MNIRLTPELERLVQQKVASGLYIDQSEVVREALRMMAERDRVRDAHLAPVRKALAAGVAEADAGELLDGAKVIRELRENARRRRKPAKTKSVEVFGSESPEEFPAEPRLALRFLGVHPDTAT